MIGIRELRADLAAHVRRAAAGEPTVVTIGGRPAAALVPLSSVDGSDRDAESELAALVSSGALVPPRRADRHLPRQSIPVWGTVRLDRLLREIRG
jgi:prevent-host-death family protein